MCDPSRLLEGLARIILYGKLFVMPFVCLFVVIILISEQILWHQVGKCFGCTPSKLHASPQKLLIADSANGRVPQFKRPELFTNCTTQMGELIVTDGLNGVGLMGSARFSRSICHSVQLNKLVRICYQKFIAMANVSAAFNGYGCIFSLLKTFVIKCYKSETNSAY